MLTVKFLSAEAQEYNTQEEGSIIHLVASQSNHYELIFLD